MFGSMLCRRMLNRALDEEMVGTIMNNEMMYLDVYEEVLDAVAWLFAP